MIVPIEKGIPIPELSYNGRVRGSQNQVAWRNMEVGDSVFIAGKTKNQVAPVASNAGSARGWQFTVRTVEGGVRVWRTA